MRPNYEGYGVNGKPVNRSTHADLDPARKHLYPFYRPESPSIFNRLPEVRPGIFYIFGEISDVSNHQSNRQKMLRTGVGVGGSGGVHEGRVKDITLPGIGHLIPMEVPERTAEEIAAWIGTEIPIFTEEMRLWEHWRSKTTAQKSGIDEKWSKAMGGPLKRAKM